DDVPTSASQRLTKLNDSSLIKHTQQGGRHMLTLRPSTRSEQGHDKCCQKPLLLNVKFLNS
ncbi:MAG: hypothetical protein WCK23_04655, partial [Actinomycetes bacterium]